MSDIWGGAYTMAVDSFNVQQLAAHKGEFAKAHEELKSRNLALNLTRGKSSSEQLDFANALLGLPASDYISASGEDARSYDNAKGTADIRATWAELMDLSVENVLTQDALSLNIQFDLIPWVMQFGNMDSECPWNEEPVLKWLCPVPGYDRHFAIMQYFGIEMVQVSLNEDGPGMDIVEKLVASDLQIKGMWNVPMSLNPTDVTYSVEVCRRLVETEIAAPDSRLMWNNAYMVHVLMDGFPEIHNVIKWAEEAGNPNRMWAFGSTSETTFAGVGIAFYVSSDANLEDYPKHAGTRGIGLNKVNQLVHAKFFGDVEGAREQMRRHTGSLAPKFEKVLQILDERLSGYGVAKWSKPTGDYLTNFDVIDGTACRMVELAKEVDIVLTGPGLSFLLKQDPNNRNTRLVPLLLPIEELEVAMDGVATCVLLAAAEKATA